MITQPRPGRFERAEGTSVVSVHTCPELTPPNSRLLLVFLAASLVAHWLFFMWVNPLRIPMQVAEPNQTPMQVRIQVAPAEQTKPRHKTKLTKHAKPVTPKLPVQTTPGTQKAGNSAADIIVKAHKAIPGILKELDSKASPSDKNLIFDPRLYEQIQQARRKQAERDALLRELDKRPDIEILAKADNYLKIRIHGQCWRIPLSHGYDPFDARIAQVDTNCPKPKLKLFDKRNERVPVP